MLRDSPTAFVNCTVWGSEDYIKGTARSFCIGDVGKDANKTKKDILIHKLHW